MKRKRVKKEKKGEEEEKRKGDAATSRWLDATCPRCGCRLRTDLRVVWCSGVACEFYLGWEEGKEL